MRTLAVLLLLCSIVSLEARPGGQSQTYSLLTRLLNLLEGREECGVPHTITAEQQQTLVDEHNKYRSGSKSSNMNKMAWSDELANVAQQLTNTCIFIHDYQKDCNKKGIGQNIFMDYPDTKVKNWKTPIKDWYDEVKDYDYDSGSCSAVCGHYKQVVWAESSEVGCAVTYCSTLTDPEVDDGNGGKKSVDYKDAAFVACNYRPGGNGPNQKPFKVGDACSDCATNMWASGWKCQDKLCVGCEVGSDTDCKCPTCSEDTKPSEVCARFKAQGTCEEEKYHTWLLGVCAKTCYCNLPPSCAAKREQEITAQANKWLREVAGKQH